VRIDNDKITMGGGGKFQYFCQKSKKKSIKTFPVSHAHFKMGEKKMCVDESIFLISLNLISR
jgi:hypothetical protein